MIVWPCSPLLCHALCACLFSYVTRFSSPVLSSSADLQPSIRSTLCQFVRHPNIELLLEIQMVFCLICQFLGNGISARLSEDFVLLAYQNGSHFNRFNHFFAVVFDTYGIHKQNTFLDADYAISLFCHSGRKNAPNFRFLTNPHFGTL